MTSLTLNTDNPPPQSITFHAGPGTDGALFTIKADGEIVRGPAFTTDDAASLKFWDLVQAAFPIWKAKALEG